MCIRDRLASARPRDSVPAAPAAISDLWCAPASSSPAQGTEQCHVCSRHSACTLTQRVSV
eukprot:12372027-Alexandrium_andersonii.AAC.1